MSDSFATAGSVKHVVITRRSIDSSLSHRIGIEEARARILLHYRFRAASQLSHPETDRLDQ